MFSYRNKQLLSLVLLPIALISWMVAVPTSAFLVSAFVPTTSRNTVASSRAPTIERFYPNHRKATTDDDDDVSSSITPKQPWTLQELEDYADSESIGVVISLTTLGPAYRAVARAKHDESIVLGYVEGFLRPTQPELLHLDKMEIFQPVLAKVRKARPGTLNFGGVNIGLGLLMGYRCLLHATQDQVSNGKRPRTVAEFLAIDDEDFQHKRLVRYYRSAGFQIVKYVGEDMSCIPDRLVWGGCGTLMKQDISVLMEKWTALFELMKARVEKQTTAAAAAADDDDGPKQQ